LLSPALQGIPYAVSQRTQATFLLEDLSSTHFQTEWPVPPAQSLCRAAVDSLAKLHALWWDDPRLGTELFTKVTKGNFWPKRLDEAINQLPDFLDFIGDRLSNTRKQVYEKILASSNQFWRPDMARKTKTFLHGDIHFWNILFPRDSAKHTIRIFDWNSWDIGKGTNDLAYMLGLHWYPSLRARFEKFLLRRYHNKLIEHGIEGYSWDDYWLDYRESCIMNLFIPIWQWQRRVTPAAVWWSHLERSFLTFDDLHCGELL
jgi:aminoglycoside phosphotransferase (APT) family kinase protein